MSSENANKNEHGANGINSLEQMIETLKEKDYIVTSQKRYRIGDPNYEEEQFYFQFLIEFNDHEQWILHHTTSILLYVFPFSLSSFSGTQKEFPMPGTDAAMRECSQKKLCKQSRNGL